MESNRGMTRSRLISIGLPFILYFLLYNLSNQIFLMLFQDRFGRLFCLFLASLLTTPFMFWTYAKANVLKAKPWVDPRKLPKDLLAVVGIVCIGILYNYLATKLGLLGDPGFQEANRTLNNGSLYLKVLTSALVVPILEELLFRGTIAGQLELFLGRIPAIVISSVLFGAMHFNVVQFVYAFLIGMLLSLAYLKSHRIWIPILAHGLTNLLVILLAA